jgi:hypothetical protein
MTAPTDATRDQICDKPPRPRRWIPLSLRIFAIILGVVGTASVLWFVSVWWGHRCEQQLVQTIEGWGGKVRMEEPEWLTQLVSDDLAATFQVFDRVASVELNGAKITDAEVVHLKRLTGLRTLVLSRTTVGDAGLAHLSSMQSLECVILDENDITGAGLVHLNGLRKLRRLGLVDMSLTDADLARLSELKGLKELALCGSPGRAFSVTDAGLVHLSGLTNLTFLNLNGTAVTDAGVVLLGSLKNLERLKFNATHVTDKGIEGLQRVLPDCKISR